MNLKLYRPRSPWDITPFLIGVVLGLGVGIGWQIARLLAALVRGQP
jgi:hypothetical protein